MFVENIRALEMVLEKVNWSSLQDKYLIFLAVFSINKDYDRLGGRCTGHVPKNCDPWVSYKPWRMAESFLHALCHSAHLEHCNYLPVNLSVVWAFGACCAVLSSFEANCWLVPHGIESKQCLLSLAQCEVRKGKAVLPGCAA